MSERVMIPNQKKNQVKINNKINRVVVANTVTEVEIEVDAVDVVLVEEVEEVTVPHKKNIKRSQFWT